MLTMRALLTLLLCTLLSGCGFQLRGNYALPFETLHIALPESSPLYQMLKRNIESSSKTRLVDTPQEAEATLTVIKDQTANSILSLSGTGRVREYQLVRQFVFRVHTIEGRDFIPQSDILLRRDLPYSDADIISKGTESTLLQRDMQSDLVQQLMRRLAAAKLPGTRLPAADAATR